MAQVYVPDNPRERAQLQRGETAADLKERPRRRSYRPRRLGGIDLVVFLGVVAAITLVVIAAARWTAPLTPAVTIDLSPSFLPVYAAYSLLPMILAPLLSHVFASTSGHPAATHR